jgi:hypothetical protein
MSRALVFATTDTAPVLDELLPEPQCESTTLQRGGS